MCGLRPPKPGGGRKISARRHLKYYFKVIEKASYRYCAAAQVASGVFQQKGLRSFQTEGLAKQADLFLAVPKMTKASAFE